MERCNHQYRPSLRGGYMCELCEKDIDSETYDEIAQLTAERDGYKDTLIHISKKDCTTWNSPCRCMSCAARKALKEAK